MSLISITKRLSERVSQLEFGLPITHIYNPLDYAWDPHTKYLNRFGGRGKEVVFVGMNPGPFGMAQTGVPFGDVALVRDWMGIQGDVHRPDPEHPKRLVQGFDCMRSEVSGARLWGWAKTRFETAEQFFERFFVANYCPLCFMEESGRNFTPDKLPAAERAQLYQVCDDALRELIGELQPEWVIGVGAFAQKRAQAALTGLDLRIGTVLHPSPASPIANRGWAEQAEKQLRALGIALGANSRTNGAKR